MIDCMRYFGLALAAGVLPLSDFAIAAPDAETPLRSLTGAPIMQFPIAGASCYGLAPLAAELRLNADTVNILKAQIVLRGIQCGTLSNRRSLFVL